MCITLKSGIEVRFWFFELIQAYARIGISEGPMLRSHLFKGNTRGTISDLDIYMHDALRLVQDNHPNILPPEVNIADKQTKR
mmetsp:Transcript_13380/g.19141  ORF Transcript_13380/g.19141 Transcript_13380/m.19141 type:complete len:82 (-) Transcript_13380:29-274(-)